jgi:hypothetical protein
MVSACGRSINIGPVTETSNVFTIEEVSRLHVPNIPPLASETSVQAESRPTEKGNRDHLHAGKGGGGRVVVELMAASMRGREADDSGMVSHTRLP